MGWYQRLVNILRPNRLSAELDREVAFHLAERADELKAGGLGEAEAMREARRRFGNVTAVKERSHDTNVLVWLDSFLADLRYAVRALRSSAGFTAVALLSLGLGLGANTAVFSLINAIMLDSLPVERPQELVQVTLGESGGEVFTNPLWESLRDTQTDLAGAFAYSPQQFNLAAGGVARRIDGNWVSGAYFATLGLRSSAGRLLEQADDRRGCPAVAVLGYGFWKQEFGGAADAIGRILTLDGHPFQIVGVLEPGFFGTDVGRATQVYAPLCAEAIVRGEGSMLDERAGWFVKIAGRRASEQSLEMLRARLGAMAPAIYAAALPSEWSEDDQKSFLKLGLSAVPASGGSSSLRGEYQEALMVLMAVVAVVLLIACGNVANLLLARSANREHEIEVRLALGASRSRLARQLLTESLLLSFLGAGAGLIFGTWASGLLVELISTGPDPVWLDLSLDVKMLGFATALAIVTGVCFGLAPVWQFGRLAPRGALRVNVRGATHGLARRPLRSALVIGQVALSLVLVVAAALLLGTFRRLVSLDPGFQRDGVLLVSADFEKLRLGTEPRRALQQDILDQLRALPGVSAASTVFITPISEHRWSNRVEVPGYVSKGLQDSIVYYNAVGGQYFETMGTARIAGRDFDSHDAPQSLRVVAINEAMAQKFFGDVSPLGRHFRAGDGPELGPELEVVAVVQNSKYMNLKEESKPTVYFPMHQAQDIVPRIHYVLRSTATPRLLAPSVSKLVSGIHPDVSLDFTTLAEQVDASLTRPRLLALLSGFFGGLALLLAVLGLYGTMAYNVTRRRSEIGVRIALGAARSRILRMIAGEAVRLIAAGILLGVLLALATARLVEAFLFGVTPSDPMVLAGSALTLAGVALLAGLVPAWRASRQDPMVALREE